MGYKATIWRDDSEESRHARVEIQSDQFEFASKRQSKISATRRSARALFCPTFGLDEGGWKWNSTETSNGTTHLGQFISPIVTNDIGAIALSQRTLQKSFKGVAVSRSKWPSATRPAWRSAMAPLHFFTLLGTMGPKKGPKCKLFQLYNNQKAAKTLMTLFGRAAKLLTALLVSFPGNFRGSSWFWL